MLVLNFLVNNCSVLKASFVLPACETDEAAPLKVQSQEEAEVAAQYWQRLSFWWHTHSFHLASFFVSFFLYLASMTTRANEAFCTLSIPGDGFNLFCLPYKTLGRAYCCAIEREMKSDKESWGKWKKLSTYAMALRTLLLDLWGIALRHRRLDLTQTGRRGGLRKRRSTRGARPGRLPARRPRGRWVRVTTC